MVSGAGAAREPARGALAFFLPFFARPNRVPRAEAAHALRAYARAPAFPAACDWLFSGRAQGWRRSTARSRSPGAGVTPLLLPRQARYFVSRIPCARLVSLEGLGHTPMYDGARTRGRRDPRAHDRPVLG